MAAMPRSLVTVDLGAIRHNVRGLLRPARRGRALGRRQGGRLRARRGRRGAGGARSGRDGALRRHGRRGARAAARRFPGADPRPRPGRAARSRRPARPGSSSASRPPIVPEGVPVHLKLDTGMGRWGLSSSPRPGSGVVGLMSHFASADTDPAFTELQLERFLAATAPYAHLTRHIANSAATLRHPALAPRRRPLRHRPLRHLAVRYRPRRRRPAARPALGVLGRARRRRSRPVRAPATAAASSRPSRPGSGSCRSATRTGSGAT